MCRSTRKKDCAKAFWSFTDMDDGKVAGKAAECIPGPFL